TGPFFQYAYDPRDTTGPTITDTLVSSGARAGCWQVMPGNDGHFVTVTNTFPVEWTSGTAVMYIDVAMSATDGPGNFCYFQILDSSGREATRIYLNRGPGATGDIHLLGRSGGWESTNPLWLPKVVVNPANNVYYKLKLVIDVTNRKYDCYVGDGDRSGVNAGHWGHFEGNTLVLDGVPAVKDLYFYYGATGLARFTWLMYRFGSLFSGPAYVYCDNLYIEGPDFGSDVLRTEIWVAKGTYVERVRLREFTHIFGGFAGNEISKLDRDILANPTVIDAGSAAPGTAAVTGAPMSTVDGFIIRGAYWGVDCGETAPVVSNNIITANAGAGVRCTGGAPLVVNNTIVGNTAAIEILGGSPRIVNNIVAFNAAGFTASGGAAQLSHNAVHSNASGDYLGVVPGDGDISCDPMFVDGTRGDFRLAFGSPCIDAGDANASPGVDAFGGVRPVDGDGDGIARVDIGAHESQFVPPYKELGEILTSADGTIVRCEDVAITKSWPDYFYVESLERIAGVKLEMPGHALLEGSLVNFSGVVCTDETGERYVRPVAVACVGSANVRPLGMVGRTIGNTSFSDGELSVLDQGGAEAHYQRSDWSSGPCQGCGISPTGLLVRVWGLVTGLAQNGFFLDDGSGSEVGDAVQRGILAEVPDGVSVPDVGSFVVVTGVVSCSRKDDRVLRLIRTNSAQDILCVR
ncbi:MAG: right-handed parallel beta-helix repeat-containing protein, partial [Armatimonadota bacterium]|nr:right-handed parallel beta-helix repeat-containing protein [Armatimonadota bacterium]